MGVGWRKGGNEGRVGDCNLTRKSPCVFYLASVVFPAGALRGLFLEMQTQTRIFYIYFYFYFTFYIGWLIFYTGPPRVCLIFRRTSVFCSRSEMKTGHSSST
jgi:hypothetical protein